MADNTPLNAGAGGDTIRDKDRTGVKTQIVGQDINIGGASEILQTAAALADATSNPTLAGYQTFPMVWNGATWDRLRSDANFDAQRVSSRPMDALGYFKLAVRTGTYSGLAANTPLFSMRWTDASKLALVQRVEVAVVTSTAASTAGITTRQLIIARSFSVSDTGGTAATLTGNNNKLRTSGATSVMGDVRWGAPITAGTRTLDSQPVGEVIGWSGLLSTGLVIGAFGSSPVGAARSTEGGMSYATMFDAVHEHDHPIVLAQNEGIVVRIGATAEPTGATQETFIKVRWAEVSAF